MTVGSGRQKLAEFAAVDPGIGYYFPANSKHYELSRLEEPFGRVLDSYRCFACSTRSLLGSY